jgi:hypothetical protein
MFLFQLALAHAVKQGRKMLVTRTFFKIYFSVTESTTVKFPGHVIQSAKNV